MLFISRTCFNKFLSLLDVAWVNKVFVVVVVVVGGGGFQIHFNMKYLLILFPILRIVDAGVPRKA